ncbi:MAG: hypothetical protein FD159_2170 [Syntrophaceae bacterium]|nr:MAG: hypothetical protein FD159_2170 [Syntrophaceae bacterium]
MKIRKKDVAPLFLAFIGVIVIAFIAIWIFDLVIRERSRSEIEAACQKYVGEAERKATDAVSRRATEFASFIDSKKAGAKPFSKDIVSYHGKWRAVKSKLPFTDAEGHKKYVAEKFNEHLFSNEDLASTIKRSVEGCIKDIEGVENELAVALQQEILGRSLAPNEMPIANAEFQKAIEHIVSASQWDAAKTAGNFAVSEVATSVTLQVVRQVYIRLGVSAGIFATGAANAWWTLGASIVIGIIVDAIWDWIDDPAGDIEREVIGSLDELSKNGSEEIKKALSQIVEQRNNLWTKTVKEMVP